MESHAQRKGLPKGEAKYEPLSGEKWTVERGLKWSDSGSVASGFDSLHLFSQSSLSMFIFHVSLDGERFRKGT